MTEEKYIDCTPTWMGVLLMAKSLAGFNNPSLLTVLEELEKPCQLADDLIAHGKEVVERATKKEIK